MAEICTGKALFPGNDSKFYRMYFKNSDHESAKHQLRLISEEIEGLNSLLKYEFKNEESRNFLKRICNSQIRSPKNLASSGIDKDMLELLVDLLNIDPCSRGRKISNFLRKSRIKHFKWSKKAQSFDFQSETNALGKLDIVAGNIEKEFSIRVPHDIETRIDSSTMDVDDGVMNSPWTTFNYKPWFVSLEPGSDVSPASLDFDDNWADPSNHKQENIPSDYLNVYKSRLI